MKEMKAILLNQAGSIDNFEFLDIEKPQLQPGEVLVNVKAIGINPADTIARSNEEMLNWIMGEERPVILGWDIAGEITEKAADTEGFNVGDAVFGLLEFFRGGKGYAEYVAAATSWLAHKPENISYEEAAAVPMAALTAWQPLVHEGNIKNGDKVLIHGGSGGVGHFAIQIAKHLGATVIATSSGKNKDFVLSLGADQHIDYKTQNFWEEVSDIDFVLDLIGGDTREHSFDVVRGQGKIISVGPIPDGLKKKADEKNVELKHHVTYLSATDMASLANLLSQGIVKPVITQTYPFTEMGQAHTQVGSGHTVGKIVVTL